jgi:hypothetical protein
MLPTNSTAVLDEMMYLQVRPRPLETPVLRALPDESASAGAQNAVDHTTDGLVTRSLRQMRPVIQPMNYQLIQKTHGTPPFRAAVFLVALPSQPPQRRPPPAFSDLPNRLLPREERQQVANS